MPCQYKNSLNISLTSERLTAPCENLPFRLLGMSMKENTIFIVDDKLENRELLTMLLSDYTLHIAESGKECLELLNRIKPDIIFLDVLMPEMDGYQVCESIRKDESSRDIPIIFVSALNTLDDRLKGYEAGGDDYIGKPYDIKELLHKLNLALENKKARVALQEQLQDLTAVAYTAMTNSSEMGLVAQFTEYSFLCQSYRDVADKIIETMENFGLNSTIQVRTDKDLLTLNKRGVVKQIEIELLEMVKKEGRILEAGHRMFINYPQLSILIKNMPLDDPDKCGRLRDHIAVIGSIGDARIAAIKVENSLVQQKSLNAITLSTHSALENIQAASQEKYQRVIAITQSMGQDIESLFFNLGLETDQEEKVLSVLDKASSQIIALFEDDKAIDHALQEVLQQLENAKQIN